MTSEHITLITPTCDQPTGIALCEQYMARQTMGFDQWIVADDGIEPATLTMGQTHIARSREHEGGRSLAGNIMAALPNVTGDIVLIIEHDDWYAPDHIATCVEQLRNAKAAGSQWQRYYNVRHRCWILMRNIGSALCNTAFRRELIPAMNEAAKHAFLAGKYGVDRMFWDSIPAHDKNIHGIDTVVGVKGLPGRAGLGLGHRPDKTRAWTYDDGEKLREWIGDDARIYL